MVKDWIVKVTYRSDRHASAHEATGVAGQQAAGGLDCSRPRCGLGEVYSDGQEFSSEFHFVLSYYRPTRGLCSPKGRVREDREVFVARRTSEGG
ncbi:hypothetical protein E2C01_021135 [Portunus trituberculatus]|uniref:Uncharacterized protein n=1 Tax=Portunus trituberculatus TaxID=210409 RepID=A0A5B7E589_PORTR|nr:hypothetical protein [Portunus trituberculatus]